MQREYGDGKKQRKKGDGKKGKTSCTMMNNIIVSQRVD